MAVIELEPKSDFIPLQTAWYDMTLRSYEIRDREADGNFHKEPYQDVQFQWEVAVPEEDPVERRSWANLPRAYNDKSKFCNIGLALGVIAPGSGGERLRIDLDTWIDKKCRGNIVEIVKDNGDVSDKITDYAMIRQRPIKPASGPAKPTRRDNEPPPVDEADLPF